MLICVRTEKEETSFEKVYHFADFAHKEAKKATYIPYTDIIRILRSANKRFQDQ